MKRGECMTANIVTRNDGRKKLAELLPLGTPLSLHIQTSNICNFKCNYCSQSLSSEAFKKLHVERIFMKMDVYTRIIDSLSTFYSPVKVLNLTGFGEPLLNKALPQMIKYAKDHAVCERVEIVTNASLLSHEMSDRLIEAGVDTVRISIQGIDPEKYLEISGVHVDMEAMREQIEYFHRRKAHTKMYVKILDAALRNSAEEKTFLSMFSGICDEIAVEHLVPVMSGIDYTKFDTEFDTGMQGYKNEEIKVCPRPFYMMVVDADGTIRPCCNYDPPMTLGNINDMTLSEAWHSDAMNKFRLMQLHQLRKNNPVCETCNTPIYGLHAEDNLDADADQLLSVYSE